jgi:hypothetical protein
LNETGGIRRAVVKGCLRVEEKAVLQDHEGQQKEQRAGDGQLDIGAAAPVAPESAKMPSSTDLLRGGISATQP